MGIVRRMAEHLGDPFLETLRDRVLEPLGLVVHLVPAVPQRLLEVGLEQPVMADHLERDPASGVGEPPSPVPSVLHQPEPGEPLHHARDRGRLHTESGREVAGPHGTCGFTAEKVNLLEIVLLGLGQ